jgi:hypothetical protein
MASVLYCVVVVVVVVFVVVVVAIIYSLPEDFRNNN